MTLFPDAFPDPHPNPHADTLSCTADGRSLLRMERRLIGHPPEQVWPALTRGDLVARWFPCEVEADVRPGGRMTFHFPGGQAPDTTGVVLAAEEPLQYVFSWGDTQLGFALEPDPGHGGTLLTFAHTFGDRYGAASFASGWHLCLTALAQMLDGGPVEVEPDTGGELHEAYLDQFDLGRGEAGAAPDGRPRIRYERQLVRPADVVWAELTGGSLPLPGGPVPPGFTADGTPGTVTEVRPRELLAYATPDGTEACWQLGPGTGHGPRLTVTVTGPADMDVDGVLKLWHARLQLLAGRLLEQ